MLKAGFFKNADNRVCASRGIARKQGSFHADYVILRVAVQTTRADRVLRHSLCNVPQTACIATRWLRADPSQHASYAIFRVRGRRSDWPRSLPLQSSKASSYGRNEGVRQPSEATMLLFQPATMHRF